MAKKRRAKGAAAAKRAKAERLLQSKPKLGKKKLPIKVASSSAGNSRSTDVVDSSEELCEGEYPSEENSNAVGLKVPKDGLDDKKTASAQGVLWAWRSMPDEEREELAKSFTHSERCRILQDIVKANEWEYESFLFGGRLTASFSRVNKWLKEHEGIGGDMTSEEKEFLIQALQYFRDKYKSTFVYTRDTEPVHCTLTIGTQTGGDYPKRFRVQAKGRSQTVLTQRNKLPLLQLERI